MEIPNNLAFHYIECFGQVQVFIYSYIIRKFDTNRVSILQSTSVIYWHKMMLAGVSSAHPDPRRPDPRRPERVFLREGSPESVEWCQYLEILRAKRRAQDDVNRGYPCVS